MTNENRQKLIEQGRQDLVDAYDLLNSGYAGIDRNGGIVDRRINHEAVPIKENKMFNTPPPIELTDIEKREMFYKKASENLADQVSKYQKAISRIMQHIDFDHWPLIEVRDDGNIEKWMPVSDEFRDDLMYLKKLHEPE